MTITLSALQKQRRDTAANWTAEDPTLLAGEIGIESDTGYWKVGDGSTAWTSLAYVSGLGGKVGVPDGTAAAPAIYFADDTDTGIYSPSANNVAISTAGTGRLFVDADGRVGIGTSTPGDYILGNSLVIKDSSITGGLTFENSAGTLLVFKSPNAAPLGIIEYNHSSSALRFFTNSSEQLIIDSSGRVGLGTSNPATLLHIAASSDPELRIEATGTAVSDDARLVLKTTNGEFYVQNDRSLGTSGVLTFNGASVDNLCIDHATGRVGVGTTGPSELLHIMAQGTSTEAVIRLDGTNSTDSPSARTEIRAIPSGSGTTSRLAFSTRTSGGALQEGFRLDEAQRLLVGTSSSSTADTLVLQGRSDGTTQTPNIRLRRNLSNAASGSFLGLLSFENGGGDQGANIIGIADGNWTDGTSHPSRLVFSTTADGDSSPTERARLENSGAFNLFSSVSTLYAKTSQAAGTSYATFIGQHTATTTQNGTNSCIIWSNGNIVNTNNSYGAISDIKLKENIVDANSQWSDIKTLRVRNYNFKEGQTHTQLGLIAQEVELVSPGLVSESPDRDAEGNDLGTTTKSVNYSVLYMKAVKALQEAMERIETLEAKVAALEA